VVIEAMKMENELKATGAGRVAEIRAVAGKTVNGGEVLLVLE
jgi:biotin carboxyl carrier protein